MGTKTLIEVLAYRGDLSNNSGQKIKNGYERFVDKLQERKEITTQGVLINFSMGCFKTKKMDYRKIKDIEEKIKGIGKGKIVVLRKSVLDKLGASYEPDPTATFKNHCLVSDIEAKAAFDAMVKSGFSFEYDN